MIKRFFNTVIGAVNKAADVVFNLLIGKTSNESLSENLGHMRPGETTRPLSLSKAYEKAQGSLPTAKGNLWMNVAKVTAVVVAVGGTLLLLFRRKDKPQPEPENSIVAAKPQAMFVTAEGPADGYDAGQWQNNVKAGRGQAPQQQGALNPKMSVVPGEMVQDLGAVSLGRK